MDIYKRKAAIDGIPLVPMLDILTILLIFFIVHTEWKRQAHVLKLDIPQTKNLSGEQGDNNSLLLEVGADGSLALGGNILTMGELPSAIQTLRQQTPEVRVQVSAAEGASMGRFIEVLDHLSAAGLHVEEIPVRIHFNP